METSEMIALAESLSESYRVNENGTLIYNGKSHDGGGWRKVLIRDQYAFKSVEMAANRDCQIEWDFYAMTTDEIRAMLARPVYISRNGRTIVMEKLDVCCGTSYQWASDELQEMMARTYNTQYLGDSKSINFGRREDGTIVMLDYGNVMYDLREVSGLDFDKLTYSKMEHIPLIPE